MHPDALQHAVRGHYMTAEEFNALVDGVKQRIMFGDGGQSSVGLSYTRNPSMGAPRYCDAYCAEAILPWSVFGIVGFPGASLKVGPIQYCVAKVGSGERGNPCALYTNGDSKIPAGGTGKVRAVSDYSPCRLRITGTNPIVGQLCGIMFGTFGVGTEGYGMVCVGTETSGGTDYAYVLSTLSPASVLGEVTTEVSAYNSGTFTLGSGQIKVKLNDGAGVIADADDPTASVAAPWLLDVVSPYLTVVPVEQLIVCRVVAGIGLVVERTIGTGGDACSINGILFTDLDIITPAETDHFIVTKISDGCLARLPKSSC